MTEKLKRNRWFGLILALTGLTLFFGGIAVGLVWKTWLMYPIAALGIVVAPIGGIIQFIRSDT